VVYHSAVDPGGGSALLVRAYGPPLAPTDWTDAEYAEIARQLARLHACFWSAAGELSRFPWLRQPSEVTYETIAAARDAWQGLQRQPSSEGVFTAPRRLLLNQLLGRVASAPGDAGELPLTLCHNDFHRENLLRADGGQFVWTDWQEVGAGYGADDLSFFCQRAAHDRAAVPLELMLVAYHDELVAAAQQPVDIHALRTRIATHELLTRLLQWPAYLVDAAPAALAAQLERIEQLAATLSLERRD
jgi:thiamine kinase-like enzyme